MANNKNGAFREIIIDRCLQSRRGYSTKEILDKCNVALEGRGDELITAMNTIRNDILSIENRWHKDVEQIRIGRELRYRYKDPNFSIYNSPFSEDDLESLLQSVSILRRFEGMPGFGWVDELNAHLQTTLNASQEPVIAFDDNKGLKGMAYFTPLFKAIITKQAIKIIYRSYKSEKTVEVIVHPYYLKEYNQRWFLFALNDTYKSISNYALDRIKAIKKTSKKFIPNNSIDFTSYFDNIVGVSFVPDGEIQSVKLWVDKEQLPYTQSKPIHKTQTIVEERVDGSAVIEIKVIPNFELQQLLLSFGERIEILEPEHLREEILGRIKNNLKKYE